MRIKNIAVCAAAAIAVLLGTCLGAPRSAFAASSGEQVMYRLYNSYTGEHLYTGSMEERDTLALVGWTYEGECWVVPVSCDTPANRLIRQTQEAPLVFLQRRAGLLLFGRVPILRSGNTRLQAAYT